MKATAAEKRALQKLADLLAQEQATYLSRSNESHNAALRELEEYIAGTSLWAHSEDIAIDEYMVLDIKDDERERRFFEMFPPPEFRFEIDQTVYGTMSYQASTVKDRRHTIEGNIYRVSSAGWVSERDLRLKKLSE